ncbi:diguanylate cyclase domain-containing protein [Jatrophihabitans sp. DSM 45814]
MSAAIVTLAGVSSAPARPADALAVAADESPSPALVLCPVADRLIVRWINQAALNMLGLERDEVADADLSDLQGEGRAELADWTDIVIRAVSDPDELPAWEWHNAAVDVPDRRLSAVQVMLRPVAADWVVWLRPIIDGQLEAEVARQESEHRFRALAEHAPVGIILSEAGVRLGFVNDKFADISGTQRSALLGKSWLTTIHPEDLPALLEILDEVLAGQPVEATVRMLSVSDSQRWVQFRLTPVTTPRRAAGFLGTVEDITARRAREAQLAYQAGHDALTGLANRRNLIDALTQLLTSRRTRDRDAAILFCDLDAFKHINDTLGHDAGDRVLIEVAQRLSATARDHDLVARIAGDEFVVLIREIGGLSDAAAAASRQLEALAAPMRVAGTVVTVSGSIGVAMAREYETAAELLRAADSGMYEAKRAGGGIYRRTPSNPKAPIGSGDATTGEAS